MSESGISSGISSRNTRSTKTSSSAKSSKKNSEKRSTQRTQQNRTQEKRPLTDKQIKRSLDPLRDQLRTLVNQANKRALDLMIAGKASRALEEARRSWLKLRSRRDDDELFKADLKTRKQINRELARVHSFLNDYTSTLQGAEDLTTDMNRLKGSWKTDEDNPYGIRDEEITKKTFELYRRVVEAAGGWERAVGLIQGKESLIGYGSENLINNIYDMVENNYDEGDIISIALEQVESGIRAYEEMAAKQVSDYDYGIVFDDETAKERRQFYMWRRNRGK